MHSLRDRYLEAEKIAIKEGFKNEIVLGNVDEFPTSELETFDGKIFIHEKIIYYTANLSRLHQNISNRMGRVLEDHLNRQLGNLFECNPGACTPFENQLGCHARWNKMADQTISPSVMRFLDKRVNAQILIPIEVSYNNESLFRLIVEGIGWTNSMQPNTHCSVLVKVNEDKLTGKFSLRIIVIAKQDFSEEGNNPNLKKTKTCPTGSLPAQKWDCFVSSEVIECFFKITLLYDALFTSEMLRDIFYGPGQRFMMPLRLLNPASGNVEELFVDIFDFLKYCASFFS